MTFGKRLCLTLGAVALGALISASAVAQVTGRLVSAGSAATSTKIIPGGTASIDMRVDVTTIGVGCVGGSCNPGATGLSGTAFRLTQSAPAASSFFSITGRSFVGSPFNDASSGTSDAIVLVPPSNLLNPDNDDNLGRTTVFPAVAPPAVNTLAANLTLTSSAATPLGTYTIIPTPIVSTASDNAFNDYDISTGASYSIIVGQTLTITKSGTGTGTVTSDIGAISCGATCSDIYPGSVVTLTATPTGGSTFIGWSGGSPACSGTGTCVVTVDAAQTVNAQFGGVPPPLQTLTVTLAGAGTGTVSSAPAGITCPGTCSFAFAGGTVVTLTATPTGGSTFTGWSGGGCSGTGTCVVTMNSAQAVTATFGAPPPNPTLTVTLAGTGTGTVASSPAGIACAPTCSAPFPLATVVTLTATPTGGSSFTGWSGAGCSGTGTCVVTMNAAQAVTATFSTPQTLTVTLAGTGTGTVSSAPAGITCAPTCSAPFPSGTVVTLTATPTGGSAFTGWSGGCSGTGTCVVTMNAAQAVTATFLGPQTLTVTLAGTGTGTVSSAPAGITCAPTCSAPFPAGTVVTLTATPTGGSAFTGWTGAGCSGTGTCVVTMNAAQAVTATFGTQPFTLSVTLAGGGLGTVTSAPAGITCPGTCTFGFPSGTSVTLTATPNATPPTQVFAGWSGAGCSGTGTCVVTMNSAQAVTATFTDSVAPTTALTGTPTNPSNQANPQFTFNSPSDPTTATFQCSLDGGPFVACSSAHTITVGNGNHTFTVRAVDQAGNVDPAPPSFTWLVQGAVAPTVVGIPTLSEWMLVLLALILGSAGILARRRKG